MRVIESQEEAIDVLGGTYKVGSLYRVTYNELVSVLGEPTLTDKSFDGKIQVEWVIEFDDEIFTIYDWKTYNREYTLNELTTWSVGGNTNSHKLETEIYRKLNEYGTEVI